MTNSNLKINEEEDNSFIDRVWNAKNRANNITLLPLK